MNARAADPVTQSRHPHTVYLTDDAWQALDRAYLELRLRVSDPPSKIEFVEQVLAAGLKQWGRGKDGSTPSTTAPRATSPDAPTRTETAKTRAPQRPKPPDGARRREPSRSKPPPDGPAQAAAAPRPPALQRLLQASDPGRPPAIHSGAPSGPGAGASASRGA
jgi:hypothetical protein